MSRATVAHKSRIIGTMYLVCAALPRSAGKAALGAFGSVNDDISSDVKVWASVDLSKLDTQLKMLCQIFVVGCQLLGHR